jgi:hypothetical protein
MALRTNEAYIQTGVLTGTGGITCVGAEDVVIDGSGVSAAGSQNAFLRNAIDASTSSLVFVDLLSLAFNKTVAGNLLLSAAWSGTCFNTVDTSDPFADFRLLLDGVAIDQATIGWFPAALSAGGTVAISGGVTIQGKSLAVAAGAHTLKLQWLAVSPNVVVSCFSATGSESASISATAVS